MQISAIAFKRIFSCKISFRYSRERALSSLPDQRIHDDDDRDSRRPHRLRPRGGRAAVALRGVHLLQQRPRGRPHRISYDKGVLRAGGI